MCVPVKESWAVAVSTGLALGFEPTLHMYMPSKGHPAAISHSGTSPTWNDMHDGCHADWMHP